MKNGKSNTGPARKRTTKTPTLDKIKRALNRQAKKVDLVKRSFSQQDFVDEVSLHLSDKVPFGKYKDKLFRTVVRNDPQYLVWLLDNNKDIRLGKDIREKLSQFMVEDEHDNPDYSWIDEYYGIQSIEDTF